MIESIMLQQRQTCNMSIQISIKKNRNFVFSSLWNDIGIDFTSIFLQIDTSRFSARVPFKGYCSFLKDGKRCWSVYPLFSERSNICPSHGTNERRRREREPPAPRQLWESDVVGFAISCSGCEMTKPLNSLRQREQQGGTRGFVSRSNLNASNPSREKARVNI